jgi:hypothetical protein
MGRFPTVLGLAKSFLIIIIIIIIMCFFLGERSIKNLLTKAIIGTILSPGARDDHSLSSHLFENL